MFLIALTLMTSCNVASASFDLPKLPWMFRPNDQTPAKVALSSSQPVQEAKSKLIQAVSGTNNGKNASTQQQLEVLRIVGDLEEKYPPSSTLLSNEEEAMALDGVWYLQYTSPSLVGDEDQLSNTWQPQFASEGDVNIETRQFKARGSVSAGGIRVDTANRVVQQVFDVEKRSVTNDVELDFGRIVVSGTFRQSPNVKNRGIVAFKDASIIFNNGFRIELGFLFTILGIVKGSRDNGWLETTFLDTDMRIGRGNKGTMFVLTRDPTVVTP